MIITYTNLKRTLSLICAVGLLGVLFASCQKTLVIPTSTVPSAKLALIQGSPDQPFLDITVDNIFINQSKVDFAESSPYINVAAGKTSVVFLNDGTGKPILTDTLNLVKDTYYSLFLANTVSSPQGFLLTDTLTKPAAGGGSFRFVNLCPDGPAIDLVIKGGATLVANRGFKGFSSFAPIAAGNVILEAHKAGTSTVLATYPAVNIGAGFVYTFWFHGLASGSTTQDKLTLDVITNAAFY